MSPIRPPMDPREGRGDLATSDFVPFCWEPLTRQGLCSQSAHFRAPEKARVMWPLLILSPSSSVDLWNPKYAHHVFKVIVAVDMLDNIVWICPLPRGTLANVLIWDGYGPSHTIGKFFDFEVRGHDGAYEGWFHVSAIHWTKEGNFGSLATML